MIKTIRELNIHFWASIIVLGVFFLLVIFNVISVGNLFAVTVTGEMYAIGITLIVIPLALKLFADSIKKIPAGTEKKRATNLYKNAWLLRLYMVNVVTLGNIVLYAVSRNTNFMWLAVVLFVVYIFCRPSLDELEGMAEEEERDE